MMKKILSIVLIAVMALAVVSCNTPKRQGEQFAKQLDELCQAQDEQGVFELLSTIEIRQNQLEIKDPDGLEEFNLAVNAAIDRNKTFLAKVLAKKSINDTADIVRGAVEGAREAIDEQIEQ